MNIENIIFDLDGTLIDSAGDIVCCLEKAYSSIPNIKIEKISSSVIGPPLNELIRKITPDITEEQICMITYEFRNCYDNSSLSETILNKGVYELIQNLKCLGIKMFIVTNKPIFVTKKILKRLMIKDYFNDVVSLDVLSEKKMNKTEMISYIIDKWKLRKDNTLMVGDDEPDIISAYNNGLRGVAILNGYGKIHGVKPSYVLNSIDNLKSLLDKLGD